MVFKKNSKRFKDLSNKSKLDQFLWFIEYYLPQKKDRGVQKKIYMHNPGVETIKKFLKFASLGSKTLFPSKKITKISFVFGNCDLPHLKWLRKMGIAK